MLGGDDDTDGIAGNIFSPGGEALEGDEVAGLDEGDEGALLVDTPEIDVAGTPITGPGPTDRFLISTTSESQPSGWLSVVLIGCFPFLLCYHLSPEPGPSDRFSIYL